MIDEKSANTSEKIVVDGDSLMQTVPENEVNVAKKCTQCGAELTEEQIFCPHCGQKNDLQVSGEVSDAIEQFNQEIVKQAKAKKKKNKILIILLIILFVIVAAAVGIYVFFNSQAQDIIDEIKSGSPSSTTIKADYDSLTPIGQSIFREKIVSAFVEEVSDHVYFNSSTSLVNESALDKYYTYKRIGQALSINSDDNTNVMDHIDHVLRLESYVKYNDITVCLNNSVSDYSLCLEYISDAGDASLYVVKLYVGYAHDCAESALSSARIYSSDDSLCTQYVDALETIEEELSDLYYGFGYYSSSSMSYAMSTINDIVTDVSDAKDTVERIENSIPKIN